jgi:hypothetical protein
MGLGVNYKELGIGIEHSSELVALLKEPEIIALHEQMGEEDAPPEAYALMHACRALGMFPSDWTVLVFLDLLPIIDQEFSDYIDNEIPILLGKCGMCAIEPCVTFIADQQSGASSRAAAAGALLEIANQHPGLWVYCVEGLIEALKSVHDDPELNAFIIFGLAELEALEAASIAKDRFSDGAVDLDIFGDYDDFLLDIGWPDKEYCFDIIPLHLRLEELLERNYSKPPCKTGYMQLKHRTVIRYINQHHYPDILICIMLADHFGVNPNELLRLAGYATFRVFDVFTESAKASSLPPEALQVAMDLAKIKDTDKSEKVTAAIHAILQLELA